MEKTLREIAQLVDGELLGDYGDLVISGATNIADAGAGDITFAVAPHLDKAAQSDALAVLVASDVSDFAKPAIRVANPRLAFTALLKVFTPPVIVERGIHATAVVDPTALLGENVAVMAHAVIDAGACVGSNTVIYPGCYLGRDVVVGTDCLLHPNVTVLHQCRIGDRVVIHSGAVIGSDGFGFVTVGGKHEKVPQVGNVVLADDVEIGANTTLDRATTGSTVVGRGSKIDNLVHLAHNVVIGEDCFLVAQTGIAGSAKIGNHVTFAGQAGSAGHLTIGDNCVFAARSAPISDIPSGSFCAGFPARPHKEWLRSEAAVKRLPDTLRKLKDLEARLAALEERK
ncbi:UDP-3-O-(3-hydroxymyristoyl)glucosamine N-acyltransferase [Azotosporobacter soli]|uniref:UDP-3-O-(3-hydroxymyristoyl)glucosamine N-acyltransferase n=1 Tax=Azotosporobacter soli TaxID=3055040 RepID=UPI0031FE6696